jgi:SAM-dependent methyltransferase
MLTSDIFHKRKDCRLCGSSRVAEILKLPACPPVDNFRYVNETDRNLPCFPMDLYMCRDCGHAQLLDVVNPKILFGNYIYTSTSSPDLDSHFSNYCNSINSRIQIDEDRLVVDIGSNDGLLLSKFRDAGWRVQGIDPASEVAASAIEAGVPTLVSFLNEVAVARLLSTCGPANLVTANNVFSHADDLRGFANCVKKLLKPQGVFVFEVSYLLDMVQGKVFDYIYHEHLAHHSIAPLRKFFDSIGMRLFDVERVLTKGGSIRGFACNQESHWRNSTAIEDLIALEHQLALYEPTTYEKMQRFIFELGAKTRETIDRVAGSGPVAAYGANATSTVLSYSLGIANRISFVIDDNPSRQGRLCPGTGCPVLPKQCLVDKAPSITFVGAWRYADLIISKNSDYMRRGGLFLVPLPEFRLVHL